MPTKNDTAQMLADRHFDLEPEMVHIYRLVGSAEIESRDDEPIKLLEVNDGTVSAGILPLHFGPMPNIGVHFSTIIVSVTPEEFRRIEAQELKLPMGWKLGAELPRPLLNQVG